LFEREHFGVLHTGIDVSAGSNFATRGVHYNRAHGGIWRYEPDACSRQLKRLAHVLFVDCHKVRDYFIT
jgi:hypothetical protein